MKAGRCHYLDISLFFVSRDCDVFDHCLKSAICLVLGIGSIVSKLTLNHRPGLAASPMAAQTGPRLIASLKRHPGQPNWTVDMIFDRSFWFESIQNAKHMTESYIDQCSDLIFVSLINT